MCVCVCVCVCVRAHARSLLGDRGQMDGGRERESEKERVSY